MLLLLTAGMLANLIYLPALLAGPLGRRIVRAEPQAAQNSQNAIGTEAYSVGG